MTVYISGPISGRSNYKQVFSMYAAMLMSLGYDVVNPADVEQRTDWAWVDYMQHDLAMLRMCSAIYMLPEWKESKGARIEKRYAKRMGIQELRGV